MREPTKEEWIRAHEWLLKNEPVFQDKLYFGILKDSLVQEFIQVQQDTKDKILKLLRAYVNSMAEEPESELEVGVENAIHLIERDHWMTSNDDTLSKV